ncbi:MAG TPA: transketolase [Thermoplasmata archaeon]|nr:transketolase [Thermoplasmata archaeon]
MTGSSFGEVDQRCVNALRFLAVDAVEAAKSGHPGLPLGAAPMAYVLWNRYLRHSPANPSWWDRDRFVLSAGHGSALLYALLHLSGYDLPLDELRRFRQWGSRAPGHPERGVTPGVEATTGPLGQGFAMGVGFALAERYLSERFGGTAERIVDHSTYGLVSDGDLMEGIASEAASLAGHIRLGKLIYLYDDNHISLEGPTQFAFTEDVAVRFAAYNWQVLRVPEGNDLAAIDRAIGEAKADTARPSLVIVRTHIGYGSPKQDTHEAHGEPLGPAATRQTKEKLGWPVDPPFLVPEEVATHMRSAVERGRVWEAEWDTRWKQFSAHHPDLASELQQSMERTLPAGWDGGLPSFPVDKPIATRDASAGIINALVQRVPGFLGGSGDLAPSTKTTLTGFGDLGSSESNGRNIHFGVRENAMAAVVNGLALHGGIRPFGASFLVFSDYARPSLRLAALQRAPSIFIFTHDSVGLGEDGPTHQPVEHLTSLRLIPDLTVLRPADANETTALWRVALSREGPVLFAFTRQKLPVLDPTNFPVMTGPAHGAYILAEASAGTPEIILVATGSEVHLALAARGALESAGRRVRVVSMPSWELFREQPEEYRRQVLPGGTPKLAIEAGATAGWWQWVGADGDVLGLDRFGASAPGPVVLEHLGFTVDEVIRRARELLNRARVPAPR